MKVKCISTQITDERKTELGLHHTDFSSYFEEGEIYTVLGLTWQILPKPALFLQMQYGFGILIEVPLDLFKIVDDRPSAFWRIKQFDSNEFTLWPKEFYQDFFHDDLSNQDPKVWEVFLNVVKKLEYEFDE